MPANPITVLSEDDSRKAWQRHVTLVIGVSVALLLIVVWGVTRTQPATQSELDNAPVCAQAEVRKIVADGERVTRDQLRQLANCQQRR